MTEIEKAYVAGFFDGEGCCSISANCSVKVVIAQKDPAVLEWMSKEYGGVIYPTSKSQGAAKLTFNNKANIMKFLVDVKPNLKAKCFEVDIAIQMLALNATNHTRPQSKNGLFMPNPHKAERDRLYQLYRAHRDRTSRQSVALRKRNEAKRLLTQTPQGA